MAINNTCILTKNPASLVEIQQKSASMALFTYEFISMEQQLHAIIQSELRTIQLLLLPMSLVLALCTICMISSLFIFVQKRQREFAVHLLCGCNMFFIGIPFMLASLARRVHSSASDRVLVSRAFCHAVYSFVQRSDLPAHDPSAIYKTPAYRYCPNFETE